MFFCCCTNCTIASDNFDRADSSTVTGWTEVAGDWSIASNKLALPSSGLGLIRFDTPDPGTADGIRWTVTFRSPGLPGALRWIVDYVDSNNYHFAELSISPDTLRVWKREGGTETALSDALSISGLTADTDHTVSVCFGLQAVVPACSEGTVTWVWTLNLNGEGLHGWQGREINEACQDPNCTVVMPAVTGTEVEGDETTTACVSRYGSEGSPVNGISATFGASQGVAATTEPLGGDYAGLQTVTTDPDVRFDNARLTFLQSGCPECSATTTCTTCEELTAPRYLLGVLEGVTNDDCDDCAVLNGTYLMEGGSDAYVGTECEGETGVVVNGCSWSGGAVVNVCDKNLFAIVVLLVIVDGEYWLYAHPYTTTTDPGATSEGLPKWRLSLGELGDPPDCETLFGTERTLTYYCEDDDEPLSETCTWASSTIRVSLP